MMQHRIPMATILGVAVIVGLISCAKDPGAPMIEAVVLWNQSESTIWVSQVDGFAFEPPAGILSPNAKKHAEMTSQRIPPKVTLVWWKGDRTRKLGDVMTTSLDYVPPKAASAEDVALIVFSKDEKWSLSSGLEFPK